MALSFWPNPMTIEEFLKAEEQAETKHELSWGYVYAMSGAGEPHRSITPALHEMCRRAMRGTPRRYFDQDTKIVIEETGSTHYADGGIACPPNIVSPSAGAIDNPKVLFEVLSPSSEARDRGVKFESYALLPSLKEYVLIGTHRPRVEVFSRQEDGDWRLRIYLEGSVAHIPSVNLDLPLDELYEDVDFSASERVPTISKREV